MTGLGFAPHARFLALALVGVVLCSGQSLITDLKTEHDPGRRSQKALDYADEAFDTARNSYKQGDPHKGDASLDDMTAALVECLDSLSASHKARFYKRAELKVAYLQRRMNDLLEVLDLEQRGWAEQTSRKLEDLHDKILEGVMGK